jgi:hypothetical protein
MNLFKKLVGTIVLFTSITINVVAQDNTYYNNIRTVRFHQPGNQLSLPVINLNSSDQLTLSFDDMDADIKNYYYTYQICDVNWQPVASISQFDYLTGFTQSQITNYNYSYLTTATYTHYQISLPESSMLPTISGNYLLKVYLDGDTSKLAFTRRMMVLNSKATVAATIVQPFGPGSRTGQRLKFTVNIGSINTFNTSTEIKAVVLQNYRWDAAISGIPPTFIRSNNLEYNADDIFVFPAGREWRWLDMKSFSLQSDRMRSVNYKKALTDVYLMKDTDRTSQPYIFYSDYNGLYIVSTLDNTSVGTQADYATVHFSFAAPNQQPYPDKDVYLYGQLTNYRFTDSTKLKFNPVKKQYEINKLLKQGYYNYDYVLVDKADPSKRYDTDGNFFDTENNYTILIYYKSFTDRTDQLIGIANFNSRNAQNSIGN